MLPFERFTLPKYGQEEIQDEHLISHFAADSSSRERLSKVQGGNCWLKWRFGIIHECQQYTLFLIPSKTMSTLPLCWQNKDVHIPIPRTCEYNILHGKRDFADVIKSGTLRWGGYPGLSGGPNVMTRVLISERGRQEGQRRRCEDGSRDWSDVIAGWKGG